MSIYANDPRYRGSGYDPGKTITAGDNYEMPEYDWKSKDFAELAKNNPHLQYEYTPGFFDVLFRDSPFKTKEKAWIDKTRNDAQIYQAELENRDREEDYNNAINQAQRMRDAGMNPNLDPSSIDAGQASENDNVATKEDEMQQNDMETISTAVSTATSMLGTITNCFVSALSMISTKTTIFKNIIDTNKAGRAGVYEIMKHVMEGRNDSNNLGTSFYPWEKHEGAYISSDQMSKKLFFQSDWVKDMFETTKEKNWAWQAYQELLDNYKVMTAGNKNETEYKESGLELGKTNATFSLFGFSPKKVEEWYRPIADFEKRTSKILAEAGFNKATFEKQYYGKAKGESYGVFQNNYWEAQGAYYNAWDGAKEGTKINTANDIYISLNRAWANMLKEIAEKASDTRIPMYDRIGYMVQLKMLGDVQNTNITQGVMNGIGAIGSKIF